MPPGLGDCNSYIAKRSEHSLLPNRCVSIADLRQTSRTISGVDKVREPAPSRTSSPSVGSFQDLAAKMPRQDNFVANKATPPAHPHPHSNRMAPPATRELAVPRMHSPVVQHDSIIPETEADATSNEVQF